MKAPRKLVLLGAAALLAAGLCLAQNRGGGFGGFGGGRGGRVWDDGNGPIVHTEGGDEVDESTVRTAREIASHSTGSANWTNAAGFEKDVFTFTRIIWRFNNNPETGRGRGGRGGRFGRVSWMGWVNDYPDADLNLSFRLEELTALRTDPDGRVIKLTNPELTTFPFIYMVKPGRMGLLPDEVPVLRKYLLNGGVLMADDFWGDGEWDSFEHEMGRVLPKRNWTELHLDHPIFHTVFDLRNNAKNDLQVPSIHVWENRRVSYRGGTDTMDIHIRAWLDDKQRIMVIALHNTDNGDGWEREGEDPEYFTQFSERRAYPLAINIIYYLMTH